jgi:predicted RecA/RadA family phage recombinase
MNNFVHKGNTLELVAPYDVVSGGGLLVGNIFGVASTDALSGTAVNADVMGVFDLAKDASVFAPGDYVYWDDAAKKATATVLSNKKAGVAEIAAVTGATTVRVWLAGFTGDVVLRVSPKATVVAEAASAAIAAADFDKIHTNTGAAAGIVLTLPAAATVAGRAIKVQLTAAQTVTLTPAAGEKVYLGGSGVASKYCLIAGVIGNFLDLASDGTDYLVVGYSGVVTKEA